MTNEKNINEIIRNLKRELKAAQKTIAFLITENSTTKTKLAEQHHFIQTANTIFSRLPGSIYWKGRNGVYLGCSDDMCNFLGMSRDQIIGHNDDYIGHILGWPKEIAAKAMKDDHDVIFNNAPRLNTEELPFSDKTGKIIHLITSKVPLLDNSGEVIGVLGFSVDISERKRMEEDLKRAKEAAEAADIAKTAFIANMSHDIRTPLSGVVGLGEIIEREIENPKHKNMVHDMVRSSYELLNMLNEILDVISLDSVTIEDVHEEPFDLLHLIQTIIDLEKSSVDLKKIALLNSLDTQIPTVLYGDHKKVHHIVLNLVGNAIKFTKEGHVEIRIKLLEKTNDIVKILFEITDTGIGIPPENLGKIFDLFYKVTPSHKGLDKGHGIGLHIVKTYTELLGGKINVESKVNEGSKFSFSLTFKIPNKDAVPKNMQSPVTTPSEKPPVIIGNTQVVPATVPTRDIGPNAPKILIIEDNNVVRMVEEDTVSAIHCKATTANDGETGLELAKNQSFDLILTDIGLPGISGIEFAKLLRQYEKDHNKKPVPIVAVTGHGQTVQKDCFEAGINHIIIKPIKPEILTKICTEFALFGEESMSFSKFDKSDSQPVTQKQGALGPDLPNTEAELFEIDNLPIFDMENAQKLLGGNTILLMKVLRDSINITIPGELPRIKEAHTAGDWAKVAEIVHKLKGGFLSASLTRLSVACQYLERYHQAGYSASLEKLYQQFLKVLDITVKQLKPWTE